MAPAASPAPAALRFAAAETSTDTALAAASTATPAVLTPAGTSTASPPLENEDGEKLYAKVTLEVLVYLGYDEGINTPDVYEPPYPYMVARTAEMTSVEIIGDPEMGIIIEYGAADDFDPDDLLVSEVKNALTPVRYDPSSSEETATP